jgi:peptidoglycan/LPS O-acetylase OafA/YrhL
MAVVGLIVTFFLFGYHEHIPPAPMRFYEFLAPVAVLAPDAFRITLHTIGATIVLLVALEYGERLRGPFAAMLGRLSFPIYLLHIPLLCSLGCAAYLFVLPAAGHPVAGIIAIVVTMAATFTLAVPLAHLDRRWLALLRRIAMPGRGLTSSVPSGARVPSGKIREGAS